MQRPNWQATALLDASTKEPSSAVVAGRWNVLIVAWQAVSSSAKWAISDDRMPSNFT